MIIGETCYQSNRESEKGAFHFGTVALVLRERVLVGDLLAVRFRDHRTVVDAVGEGVEMNAVCAEPSFNLRRLGIT